MTRSERLAQEGKIEVYCGELITAKVITDQEYEKRVRNLRYIGSESEVEYNGKLVDVHLYEEFDSDNHYAVIY